MDVIKPAPTFHSRAIKKASHIRAQISHCEGLSRFRNPGVAIEMALEQELSKTNGQYIGSSHRRKNVLINALEDLAKLDDMAFSRSDIEKLIAQWRKPSIPLLFNMRQSGRSDCQRTKDSVNELREKLRQKKSALNDLMTTLDEKDEIISDLEQKIEDARNRIFRESDMFAEFRGIAGQLDKLRNDRDKILGLHMEPDFRDEDRESMSENAYFRTILVQRTAELCVARKVTERFDVVKNPT
jgi:hypothetical protein